VLHLIPVRGRVRTRGGGQIVSIVQRNDEFHSFAMHGCQMSHFYRSGCGCSCSCGCGCSGTFIGCRFLFCFVTMNRCRCRCRRRIIAAQDFVESFRIRNRACSPALANAIGSVLILVVVGVVGGGGFGSPGRVLVLDFHFLSRHLHKAQILQQALHLVFVLHQMIVGARGEHGQHRRRGRAGSGRRRYGDGSALSLVYVGFYRMVPRFLHDAIEKVFSRERFLANHRLHCRSQGSEGSTDVFFDPE